MRKSKTSFQEIFCQDKNQNLGKNVSDYFFHESKRFVEY